MLLTPRSTSNGFCIQKLCCSFWYSRYRMFRENTEWMKSVYKQPNCRRMISLGYTSEVQITTSDSLVIVLFIFAVVILWEQTKVFLIYVYGELTLNTQLNSFSPIVTKAYELNLKCDLNKTWVSKISCHTCSRLLSRSLRSPVMFMDFGV